MSQKKKGKKKKKAEASNSDKDELINKRTDLISLGLKSDILEVQAENAMEDLEHSKRLAQTTAEHITRQQDIYDAELAAGLEQSDTQYLKDRYSIKVLLEQGKVLRSQARAAQEIEVENETLRERVRRLTRVISEQAQKHGETIWSLNYDKFDVRDRLETTYRKALRDAYAKQRSHAYLSLDNHSRQALDLNAQLKQEMDYRMRGVKRLKKEINKNRTQITGIRHRNKHTRNTGKQQMHRLALQQRASTQYKMRMKAFEDELVKRNETIANIGVVTKAARKMQDELLQERKRRRQRILQLQKRHKELEKRLSIKHGSGPKSNFGSRNAKGKPIVKVASSILATSASSIPTTSAKHRPNTDTDNSIVFTDGTVSKTPPSFKYRPPDTQSVSSHRSGSVFSSGPDFSTRFFTP